MPKLEGKGCVLHSQAREIVFNVYNYFKTHQEGKVLQSVLIDKVEEATKVPRRTVERILQTAKKQSQGNATPNVFTTPRKVVDRKKPIPVVNKTEMVCKDEVSIKYDEKNYFSDETKSNGTCIGNNRVDYVGIERTEKFTYVTIEPEADNWNEVTECDRDHLAQNFKIEPNVEPNLVRFLPIKEETHTNFLEIVRMSSTNGNQTKLLHFSYLMIGISVQNFKPELNFKYLITIILFWIINFILIILKINYSHDSDVINDAIDAVTDIVFGLFSVTATLVSLSQKHNYGHVYKAIVEGLYNYDVPLVEDAEIIKNKYMRKATLTLYCAITINIIAGVNKLIIPLFFGIVHIMYTEGDVKPLPLALACWFPFSLNTLPRYLFAYSITMVPAAASIFGYSSWFSIVFLSTVKVLSEIEVLSTSIKRLKERALLLVEEMPSHSGAAHRVDECFKMLTKQAIQHHEQIIIYIRRLNCLFCILFLTEITTYGIVIRFSSFRISVEPHLTTSISLYYIGLISVSLFGVWILSWMGQLVINAGDELRNALYCSNWEVFPKSMNKYLLIMGEVLNKPLCLKVGGIYVLRLEIFTTVLHLTYSYFNVLRTFRFSDST